MKKILLYTGGGIVALLFIIGALSPEPEKDLVQNIAQDVSILPTTESTTTETNSASQLSNTTSSKYYTVSRVVDGDTIDVSIEGKIERLRLIGVDTPETVDPRKPVECFGTEASNKAKSVLTGKKVSLESDNTQGERDKYDRLLRYLFLEDGTNFNLLMVKEGYAHEYTYDLPYKYQTEFKNAQKLAEANKVGLWSPNTCNGNTTTSSSPSPSPASTTTQTGGTNSCTIKGNISSSGEKIFHVIGCGSYNATKIDESRGEKWFCSEQEAVTAGWRKALNCN